MVKGEITFDRFVRGTLFVLVAGAGVYLLNYLSGVLIPFFVAWVLAYMLDPVVTFMQRRMFLRHRVAAVGVTFLLLLVVVGLVLSFVIPMIVAETIHLKNVTLLYLKQGAANSTIPALVENYLQNNVDRLKIEEWLQGDRLNDIVRDGLPRVWSLVSKTANVIVSIVSSLITLLYLVFILVDYERLRTGWLRFVPSARREFVKGLADDVTQSMNRYFRGQSLVAFSVGVMFSIGFLIIDFPMAIVLGMFLGLLNLVPYLQLVGFVPTLVLALLKAADTGENFWVIIAGALVVFAVVQIIQDAWLTPKVMGRIMGLSPTVILLSLSVWGYLLGIIGLIIALPLTTLIISYYKRYVVTSGLEERFTK